MEQKMTLKRLQQHCRSLGLGITKRDGEYRIAPKIADKALAERIAYYTTDLDDAYDTATMMAREPHPDSAKPRHCERCGALKPIGQSCICFDNNSQ